MDNQILDQLVVVEHSLRKLRYLLDAVLKDKQSHLPSTAKRKTPDEVGSENVTVVDMTDDPDL